MPLTDIIRTDALVKEANFAVLAQPGWTRLEPQSVAGDPKPGLEMRVHDPLWMLTRQWQLGEFAGEDAGTPVSVRVASASVPLVKWQPGAWDPGPGQPARDFAFAPELLEPLVERESVSSAVPGLRQRLSAALVLLAAADDAGFGSFRDAMASHCPVDTASTYAADPEWVRLQTLASGIPDAEKLALAFEAAGGLAPWMQPALPADQASLGGVVADWLAWYRAEVSPRAADTPDSWVGDRLEYRFSVAMRDNDREIVLRAPAFDGGPVDWYAFDQAAQGSLGAQQAAQVNPELHVLAATPLRFPGMPADRLWEFEDAQVNLGALEAEPYDLARLLLVEFAMAYGSDWIVVPLDVPFGSFTTLGYVLYTTTFGETFLVPRTDAVRSDDPWRMFSITDEQGRTFPGLLVPPATVARIEGEALEEVLFLRDEMANLVWGVERRFTAPSGYVRSRANEQPPPGVRPSAAPVPTASLDYLLENTVPPYWIPYVPRSSGYRSIELVRGAMLEFAGGSGVPVLPFGKLLTSPSTARLKDAEVPREGVKVSRVPVVARRTDGSYARWIGKRVETGRGEGSSGLSFDEARLRRPSAAGDGTFTTTAGDPTLPDPGRPDPPFDPLPERAVSPALDFSALPEVAPGGGGVDPFVKLLQALLNAQGVGVGLPIDGLFSLPTQAAVSLFRAAIGMPAGNNVDSFVWTLLSSAAPFVQLEPGIGDPPMSGPQVAAVQTVLNLAGANLALPVSGSFDAPTVAALSAFQTDEGIAASGVVDRDTWDRLNTVGDRFAADGSLRFTFDYDSALWAPGVSPVTLSSTEALDTIAPRSDDIGARSPVAGFWVEVQDESGRVLYRRDMGLPLGIETEVYGDGASDIASQTDANPKGSFEIVVPNLVRGKNLVLFSSPLDPARLTEPAEPIATFSL
jgi:peptidoglycan hydrolase-like protein with peptidoglycan-binding domain